MERQVRPRLAVRGLVALNVGLLVALSLVAGLRPAGAQNAPGVARARGEYTMVAGKSNAGGTEVVYVIDASNQEIVALKWDQSRQAMTALGYRAMGGDLKVTPGR